MIPKQGRIAILLAAFAVLPPCVYERVVAAQSEYAGRGASGAVNSVYRIACPDRDRSATGFGHRSGRIITAEHVVRDCDTKKLQVIAPSGAVTGIVGVASDTDLDLALLTPSVADFVKVPLDVASDASFRIGAQVSTWGFPAGYSGKIPLLSVGYLAGIQELPLRPGVVVRRWIVNGAFNLGNSGGPLLETSGAKVVGVISSKLAPIPKELESRLETLEKKGSAEAQAIAKVLRYLRNQTQLVLGFATMNTDLNRFLKKSGVEP